MIYKLLQQRGLAHPFNIGINFVEDNQALLPYPESPIMITLSKALVRSCKLILYL